MVVIGTLPAAGAVLLVLRGRLLRHFAKTPIKQTGYVSLKEPIYDYYNDTVGHDEDGHPIIERKSRLVGYKRRDIPHPQRIDPCYVDLLEYIGEKGAPFGLVGFRSGVIH